MLLRFDPNLSRRRRCILPLDILIGSMYISVLIREREDGGLTSMQIPDRPIERYRTVIDVKSGWE